MLPCFITVSWFQMHILTGLDDGPLQILLVLVALHSQVSHKYLIVNQFIFGKSVAIDAFLEYG